jgi:hypothetical protein
MMGRLLGLPPGLTLTGTMKKQPCPSFKLRVCQFFPLK